jgi:amino acid transporter
LDLKRTIGTWGLLFAAVGGIVGSGWLFGPYYLARFAGPASVLSWVAGGGLMMVVALTFAELSSTFPVAGGTVRFLQLSHGPMVSFTMAWIGWIAAAAVAPIETMALIQYASNYIPHLMYGIKGTHVLTTVGILVAASLMLVMCFINAMGAKFLSKTNSTVVVFKLMIPILTLVVLLTMDFHISNFTSHGFAPTGIKGVLTALPTAGVIFSFIGYSPAIQLAGEAKTPQRSVPIAIIGALLFCIFLYVLLQISFIGAVHPQDFAQGWSHLSFKGDTGPFAGIAMGLGATWLAMLLFADAGISPFGTALIYTAATARICYAMGENGYLPHPLMKLSRFGIPLRIIALNFIIGVFLLLPFPSWQKLVGFLVSALVFSYAVGPLALPVLRRTLPNQPRPFRVPFPKLMCPLAFYICNLIIYWSGWDIVFKILVAIVIGYLVLLVFMQTQQGKKLNLQWRKAWWVFIYVAALGLVSYFGAFGGNNTISFGWDFLVIGVMTWLIFQLSQFLATRGLHDEII